MTRAAIVAAGVLGAAGLVAAAFVTDSLLGFVLTMFLAAVALGFAIGRWWAVPLALLWLIPAAFTEARDFTFVGKLLAALILQVGPTAVALALGVNVRGHVRRRRARLSAAS